MEADSSKSTMAFTESAADAGKGGLTIWHRLFQRMVSPCKNYGEGAWETVNGAVFDEVGVDGERGQDPGVKRLNR